MPIFQKGKRESDWQEQAKRFGDLLTIEKLIESYQDTIYSENTTALTLTINPYKDPRYGKKKPPRHNRESNKSMTEQETQHVQDDKSKSESVAIEI